MVDDVQQKQTLNIPEQSHLGKPKWVDDKFNLFINSKQYLYYQYTLLNESRRK